MFPTAQVLLDKPASLKHGVRQLTVRDVVKELKSTVEQHDVDISALKKDCRRYEEELQGVRLPCIGSRVDLARIAHAQREMGKCYR